MPHTLPVQSEAPAPSAETVEHLQQLLVIIILLQSPLLFTASTKQTNLVQTLFSSHIIGYLTLTRRMSVCTGSSYNYTRPNFLSCGYVVLLQSTSTATVM